MDTADLVTALRRRNPATDGPLGAAHWRFMGDAIDGAGGFLAGLPDREVYAHGREGSTYAASGYTVARGSTYLVQFPRETEEAFAARVKATTYDNHVAPVARTYSGQLWQTPPTRETTIPAVQAFWRDPDAGLADVDGWMRDGSERALRCGWCACLIDRPEGVRPAGSPGTRGRWLECEELADWQCDESGAFQWVKLRSETCERDPLTGEESERETVTIWTPATWRRLDLRKVSGQWAIDDDSGDMPHDLGRVPVAVLRWVALSDADDLLSPSPLMGSAAAALELFNVRSEMRSIERGCVFPILTVESDDADVWAGIKPGVQNGIRYAQGTAQPAFISPDAAVTIHYAGRVEELTTRVYEAAYLERPSAQAAAPESGVSRAFRFRQQRALLASAARYHAAFEREVVDILARWDGADGAEWQRATSVAYPQRFDAADSETEMALALTALEKADALCPEVSDQSRRTIARALFPQLSSDARTRLDDELAQRAAFERAQFAARFSAQASVDAATQAAVSALPEAAPGEVVSLSAATNGPGTTAAAGE